VIGINKTNNGNIPSRTVAPLRLERHCWCGATTHLKNISAQVPGHSIPAKEFSASKKAPGISPGLFSRELDA
jgi:hypothetical protein